MRTCEGVKKCARTCEGVKSVRTREDVKKVCVYVYVRFEKECR